MIWPELLVVVRHGQSEANVLSKPERNKVGKAPQDWALTKQGCVQADVTGEYLRSRFGNFDRHFVSPYRRAQETAEIMYPDVEFREDSRLSERQNGIWDDLDPELICRYYPLESHRREREGEYYYRPVGGESWPDVELRAQSFLSTLSRDCAGQKVLVVGHGHWLILLMRILEGFSIEEASRLYHEKGTLRNASVALFHSEVVLGREQLRRKFFNFVP